MKLITTVEINEIEQEVLFNFTSTRGEIHINSVREAHSAIELDIEKYATDEVLTELEEYAVDFYAERRRSA